MEEMFEALPWVLGGTIVTSVVGAGIGAKYAGPAGAIVGVIGGPVLTFGTLVFGAIGAASIRDLYESIKRQD